MQSFCNSISAGEFADMAPLLANQGFDGIDGIRWAREPMRIFSRKHGDIVPMVARGKYLGGLELQALGQFREGGAFIIGGVTEPSVNVVPHHG